MTPPCGIGQAFAGVLDRILDQQAASARQRGVAVLAQLLARPVDKFIDIAVVVGEQDEALEMLCAGAGVVRQPGEAEIGPKPVEQRERDRVLRIAQVDPVGQFVADQRQFGGGKMPPQFDRADPAKPRSGVDHIREGDFLSRAANLDLDLVILGQYLQLFGEVGGEQLGPGDGGGESAGAIEPPEGALEIGPGFAPGIVQPQFGIAPGAAGAAISGGRGAVGGEGGNVGTQGCDGRVVNLAQIGDDGFALVHRAKDSADL